MARFIACLLFVFGFCAAASAQEQTPKASVDEKFGRLLQALLDMDEKVERLGELVDADRTDRQHDEAQLREECAALKAKVERLEMALQTRGLPQGTASGPDPKTMKVSQLEGEISQIDCALRGRVVRTGWRRYATQYPSTTRRQELLTRRERLVSTLSMRYSMAFLSNAMSMSIAGLPLSDEQMKSHMGRMDRIQKLRAGQKGL